MNTFDPKKRSTFSFEEWKKNYKKMQTANQIKKGEADITADGMLGNVKGKDGRADLSNPKDVVDKKKHEAVKATYGGAVKGKEGYETELDESLQINETLSFKGTISRYLKNINLEKIVIPFIDELPEGGNWTKPVELKLDNFGQLAPIIKECNVHYSFAFEPKAKEIYLNLEYKYLHPSGSNGYKSCLIFDTDGVYVKTIEGYRVAL